MNKRTQKKSLARRVALLERATPQYAPGGAFQYLNPGQLQGPLGATFYGATLKNSPVQPSTTFSPGIPIAPQPVVNAQGKPYQYRYPIAWNTFSPDRTLGREDVPSFETLRRLAKMYSGITLCERYWLDMVPRMRLEIRLKQACVDAGAEPKQYQKEMAFFKTFWEKPDGKHDLHAWLRMALREQTQIDELYLYKNRTRGGKLLGLWIVAGDQMKPLLDDWGALPDPPHFAYQQYPWGIPGMQYSTEMMIHYQETPQADSPYGQSRVERIILEVNEALRKKKKDLANFTEGNIPQSFMEVPEALNWTPDQIDAFEQSWNALLAGSAQQQVRIKFLQPGMKYTPAEQYQINFDPDTFLFKIACGNYGVPITEFGFTEDSNRSSGESQEDVVYRRTIGPNAETYARIQTQSMAEDFPEELHGEMFEAYYTGYEEVDDEEKTSNTLKNYTSAGILGLTDAAKLANLPIDPDAPVIGRVVITKDGPIFLDDIATPEMRAAKAQAILAGNQLAANPQPAPGEDGADASEDGEDEPPAEQGQPAKPKPKPGKKPPPEEDSLARFADVLERAEAALRLAYRRTEPAPEQRLSQQGSCQCNLCSEMNGQPIEKVLPPYHDGCDCKAVKESAYVERTQSAPEAAQSHRAGSTDDLGRSDTDHACGPAAASAAEPGRAGADSAKAVSAEYRRWRARALDDVKAARSQRGFTTTLIPEYLHTFISRELATCTTAEDVRRVFERAKGTIDTDSGGWQETNPDVQAVLADYQQRGVVELEWHTAPAGVCDQCARNAGQRVKVGTPFNTGALMPFQHPRCECWVTEIMADGSTRIGYGIGARAAT